MSAEISWALTRSSASGARPFDIGTLTAINSIMTARTTRSSNSVEPEL
jgi:hypothetical protein